MKRNASEFLWAFVHAGSGANMDFAKRVATLVNDDALLDEHQQEFVLKVVQQGADSVNYVEITGRQMLIANFINSCH